MDSEFRLLVGLAYMSHCLYRIEMAGSEMASEFRIQITGRFGLYESLLYRIEMAGSEMDSEFRIQSFL